MKKCPFLNKKCIKENCMMWTHLIGKNPQTNAEVDEFGCAVAFLPILLIENAKNVAQAQSAVESFRNKSVVFQDNLIGAIAATKKINASEEPKKISPSTHTIESKEE